VRKDVSDLQKESDRIGEWQKAVSEHGDELVKMVKMVKMIVVHWEDHIDPLFITLYHSLSLFVARSSQTEGWKIVLRAGDEDHFAGKERVADRRELFPCDR